MLNKKYFNLAKQAGFETNFNDNILVSNRCGFLCKVFCKNSIVIDDKLAKFVNLIIDDIHKQVHNIVKHNEENM